MTSTPATAYYDARAAELAERYELASAETVNGWLANTVDGEAGLAIDVGASSGRDAAWLAGKGWNVVAVEPSAGMRAEGQRRHGSLSIQWEADKLPALPNVTRLGYRADLVLANAVWMHVSPSERNRALRKFMGLTKSGGLIAITLRQGPAEDERVFHPATAAEIKQIARSLGLTVELDMVHPDALGRTNVSWECVALRLPDDGTNALPLLRRIILNDSKTSTYKLALLRAITASADAVSGLADIDDGERVVIPMGVVALNWLRLYLPLLRANLPQSAINRRRGEGLGFVTTAGAEGLIDEFETRLLRVGALIADAATAQRVRLAVRDAVATIAKNPVKFIAAEGKNTVFRARTQSPNFEHEAALGLLVDDAFVRSFGTLSMPVTLWTALQRYSHWIDPALTSEWTRLMEGFAKGNMPGADVVSKAMAWGDPVRDTNEVRGIVIRALGRGVRCVWTGEKLTESNFDVDHCFPWSAWPCGDLWNLMPALRRVNQRDKRHRMPSAERLDAAKDGIVEWWEKAYLTVHEDRDYRDRFRLEAHASLAALSGLRRPEPVEIIDAMQRHRLRLWQDQREPEWG
jgi:SAM-dependent methyltransferase